MFHKTWRRRWLVYCLSSLSLLCVLYCSFTVYLTNIGKAYKPVVIHELQLSGILKCHYSREGDALPSAEDASFSPGVKAIFFHETSCRGDVDSKQACAVESVARLHPNWQINLLFSSPVTKHALESNNLAKLQQFRNVKLARVHIDLYGKGTIAEETLIDHLRSSSHPVEHAADILRIVTLHKFGGVYLDTDSMVVQNLDWLFTKSNFIVKQSPKELATGIMAFSKDEVGKNMTKAILREFNDQYTPNAWAHNGPRAIQRVLKRICPGVVRAGGDCAGIRILLPSMFYPIFFKFRSLYYLNGSIDNMVGPYMHHMWNHLSKGYKIETNSPYAKLARMFCPTIYQMYSNRFGE